MSKWRLEGLDTFSNEEYDIPGEYDSEQEALKAAETQLASLEDLQPSQHSGGQGQGGIQDRIFIVRPDGRRYRYMKGQAADLGAPCTVIHVETPTDILVRKDDGETLNVVTSLLKVRVGEKGYVRYSEKENPHFIRQN